MAGEKERQEMPGERNRETERNPDLDKDSDRQRRFDNNPNRERQQDEGMPPRRVDPEQDQEEADTPDRGGNR